MPCRLAVVLLPMLALSVPIAGAAAATPAPREVSVGVYLLDITRIDETANQFSCEADVRVRWRDADLAFDPDSTGVARLVYSGAEAREQHGRIWTAQIAPTNPVGGLTVGGEKLVVSPDGAVELTARIATTLRANLDFRQFPFDSQVLPLQMESFSWNRDEVVLVSDDEFSGYEPMRALAEWSITGVEVVRSEELRVRDVVPYANLAYRFTVQRDAGYYVWKIFLTVAIIVALTWVVFWMSGEGLGRRAGVSSGGILSVIAYQFVTSSSLPRVSYLTVADKVMILSIVVIALTMLESLVVDRWSVTAPERKLAVDRACRVAFPVVYFGMLVVLGAAKGVL
ncbi:hypothetical protein KDM41_11025 [bacterium]|nr:hypothetical protein [bacterium]